MKNFPGCKGLKGLLMALETRLPSTQIQLSCADIFQHQLFRKILSLIPSVSNSLEPDQARNYVGPDVGPNCLQRLSAADTNRQTSADIFQHQFFRKILSWIPSECQTVWIQIRPDIMSGLIWVQTVCNGYQQPNLIGKQLLSPQTCTYFFEKFFHGYHQSVKQFGSRSGPTFCRA